MTIAVGTPGPGPRSIHAQRALAHWPRLDRARLRRARGDRLRIARLVERRSVLTRDQILAILDGTAPGAPADAPGLPG